MSVAEEPTSAIALRSPANVGILKTDEINDLWRLADGLSKSQGFLPVAYSGKPGNVFAAIMTGRDLGLGPMVALREIHIIDGKPGLSAALMMGLIRDSGQVKILESGVTDEKAWIKAERNGEVSLTEWTFAEAQRITRKGNLLVDGDNWRNYRQDMLWARCVGRFARRHCSDLLLGFNYSVEELRDMRDENGPHLVREHEVEVEGQEVPEGGEGSPEEPREETAPPFDLAKYAELDAAKIKLMLPLVAQRADGKQLLEAVLSFEQNGASPGGKNRSTIVSLIEKLLAEPTTEPAAEPAEKPVTAPEEPAAAPAEPPADDAVVDAEVVGEGAQVIPMPERNEPPAPSLDDEPESQVEPEVDEIKAALIRRVTEGCALIVAQHPEHTSWTPEGLVALAEGHRKNPQKPLWRRDIDEPYSQLSDFTPEQLARLWQSFPEDTRAVVEAEAGDA